MIHPDTELRFISEGIGYGVVATHRIPKGTILWVLDDLDQRISPERASVLGRTPEYRQILKRYGFDDGHGTTIVCWDNARFVNHSCAPTCGSGDHPQIEVAVRDILPGEQLTDDYSEYSHEEPFECACGARQCRGRITPDGREAHLAELRWQVSLALLESPHVEQPLASLALCHGEPIQRILEAPDRLRVRSHLMRSC